MKAKNIIWILLIVILGSLIGCQNLGGTDSEPDNVNEFNEESVKEDPTPTYGGEINISIRNPITLNPILNSDRTIDQMLKLVFEPLFELNEHQQPEENLIASYNFSEDGSSILLTLKEGLVWQDGTPITSDDILFTIDALQDADPSVVYKKMVSNIARVSKVSDLETRIYFNQASSLNLYYLTFPIIPKHYYEGQMTIDAEVSLKPLGNGMYTFESYSPMKQVVLTRNDTWYKGKPYLDQVNCLIISDSVTDASAFDQNIIQVLNPSIFNWQDYAEKEGLKTYEYTSYYYDFIGINFSNELLSDPIIRKALIIGLDRQEILDKYYLGHGIIVDAPLHPESFLRSEEILNYDYNQEEANTMLSESGWELNDETGLLERNGESLNFTLLINEENESNIEIGEEIKEQLATIGIGIELNLKDATSYQDQLANGDYDLMLGGWKLSSIPDLSFAFHSEAIKEGSNFLNYGDEEMDGLLSQAYFWNTEEEILTNYHILLDYIQKQLPYISLYFKNSVVLLNEEIDGDLTPSTYNIYKGFETLYRVDTIN